MRGFVAATIAVLILISMSVTEVHGTSFEENLSNYGADKLYSGLPDETKNSLGDMGISGIDPAELGDLSFDKILSSLGGSVADSMSAPLKMLAALLAVMILYSLIYGLRSSSESAMSGVLSLCTTLCVSCITVVPMISFVDSATAVVENMANFMQTFVPIIVVVITASGRPASGTSYYAFTVAASQIAVKVFSEFIVPFTRIMLSLSLVCAVNVNMSGIIRAVSRFSKWALGFVMTLFTGLLSVKQVLASGSDKLSDRAVRFAVSGSVPVVGSSLSEAYKTVRSSLDLLRSGIGVFAVAALAVTAAPALISCLCWMVALSAARAAGELLGLREPCTLLEAIGNVVGMFFAVMLSCAAMFIISAALVLMTGGGE